MSASASLHSVFLLLQGSFCNCLCSSPRPTLTWALALFRILHASTLLLPLSPLLHHQFPSLYWLIWINMQIFCNISHLKQATKHFPLTPYLLPATASFLWLSLWRNSLKKLSYLLSPPPLPSFSLERTPVRFFSPLLHFTLTQISR